MWFGMIIWYLNWYSLCFTCVFRMLGNIFDVWEHITVCNFDDVFWFFCFWEGKFLGPNCPGPNLTLFQGGQLGPGQSGPGAQLSGAQFATFGGRTVGPQTTGPRGPTVRGPVCLEPFNAWVHSFVASGPVKPLGDISTSAIKMPNPLVLKADFLGVIQIPKSLRSGWERESAVWPCCNPRHLSL